MSLIIIPQAVFINFKDKVKFRLRTTVQNYPLHTKYRAMNLFIKNMSFIKFWRKGTCST